LILLQRLRFVIVTGKGGVGKTTVCAVHARALAARGRKVLVAMCHAKERLSAMLGSGPIGPDIAQVAPGIWAVNMDPARALEEYGLMTLKVRLLYRTVFENRYTRAFLRAVPGVEEWSMLGKAWWHTGEVGPDGAPRFDVVLLDAPATGHAVTMLRVPKIIVEVTPPGILRRDAERAREMLTDPERSGVVLVTSPEDMPVVETVELAHALRDDLSMPIAQVVVNRVMPELFSKGERSALAGLQRVSPPAVASGLARAVREGVQADALAKLAIATELEGVPRMFLPLLLEDAATPAAIEALGRSI
jgi:anion-transporting  ArsA/GET3 family ATPase